MTCGGRSAGRTSIEAELKARVHDPAVLRERLRRLAGEELSVYRDTYYDRAGRELTAQGRELRVRVMETSGVRRAVLTYKEPAADAASGSKPEHETKVADAAVDEIFRVLGLEHLVAFEKHCAAASFTAKGRDMLATMVTVPEIDGTFVELETLADEAGLTGGARRRPGGPRRARHRRGRPDHRAVHRCGDTRPRLTKSCCRQSAASQSASRSPSRAAGSPGTAESRAVAAARSLPGLG